MPTFLIDHFWPGMLAWSLLYISDYALTIACARLYRGQETVICEGSYEITPFFQGDIDSLRVVSPRFVFMLFLSVGALGFLWFLNRESSPELYQFALGALIGVQLAIHMRHLRNLVLFRTIKQPSLVRGRIEYSRMAMLRASSWECFAFSGFFLMLFVLTQSWFMVGSTLGCFSLGLKHRRLTSKVQTNLAGVAQSPQQT